MLTAEQQQTNAVTQAARRAQLAVQRNSTAQHQARLAAEAATRPAPGLTDLLREVDPDCTLDPDAEQLLLHIAEDFLDELSASACAVAQHRRSDTLEAKDIAFSLKKYWGTEVAGGSAGAAAATAAAAAPAAQSQ